MIRVMANSTGDNVTLDVVDPGDWRNRLPHLIPHDEALDLAHAILSAANGAGDEEASYNEIWKSA